MSTLKVNTINESTANSGVAIEGTGSNDAAAAGYVGETLSQSRLLSASTALPTGSSTNVTASPLTLSPGDWLVRAIVGIESKTAGGTLVNAWTVAISSNSSTLPASSTLNVPTSGELRLTTGTVSTTTGYISLDNGEVRSFPIPPYRASFAVTTTLYLVTNANVVSNSLSTFGFIEASRMR